MFILRVYISYRLILLKNYRYLVFIFLFGIIRLVCEIERTRQERTMKNYVNDALCSAFIILETFH